MLYTKIRLADLPQALLKQPQVENEFKLLRALEGNKLGVFAYCFCEIR